RLLRGGVGGKGRQRRAVHGIGLSRRYGGAYDGVGEKGTPRLPSLVPHRCPVPLKGWPPICTGGAGRAARLRLQGRQRRHQAATGNMSAIAETTELVAGDRLARR